MEKAGGNNNAYTTRDVTVYTDWFPRTALRLMFDMEADRIRDLAFDPKIIESERGVVASERLTRTDNSNFGLLYEQLNAAAYTAHPYGWPVVGWPSDIKSWSMDDLKAHFKMGYAPNNCVMVVVGDVTADEVLKLAKEYMEPIPRQDPPPPVRTVEPPQIGERRVTIVKQLRAAVSACQLSHSERVAQRHPRARSAVGDSVGRPQFASVFAHGRSRPDGAERERASGRTLDPGQFICYIRPRAGVDVAQDGESAVRRDRESADDRSSRRGVAKGKESIADELLSGDEDDFRPRESTWYRRDFSRQFYQAMYDTPSRYEAVTAADVLRVAKQYLGPNQRTIATLIPEVEEVKTALTADIGTVASVGESRRSGCRSIRVRCCRNGAVLDVMPRKDVPLVTIKVVFKGGVEAEPAELSGIAERHG